MGGSMKKKNVILIMLLVVVIIVILLFVVYKIDMKRMENNEPVLFSTWGYDYAPPVGNLSFELIYESENDEEIHKILAKGEIEGLDYKVCTYGGNVKIKIGDETLDLREAFLLNKITPIDIINKVTNEKTEEEIILNMYQDGGTVVYKYDNYCIIKFNTLSGNKDLYISKLDFSYDKLNNN